MTSNHQARNLRSLMMTTSALFLILGSGIRAQAQQWTTSGNNIYNANSGNVGIGTATPYRQFHIQSDTATLMLGSYSLNAGINAIEFNHQGATYLQPKTAILTMSATPGYGTSDLFFVVNSNSDGSAYNYLNDTKMVIKAATGNIGIGTTSPAYKLHVVGQINIQNGSNPYLRLSASSATWDVQSASSHFDIRNGTVLGMNIDHTNGNVGFGTTNPSTRLHVVGDVTVTGNIAAKYQDLAEWVPAGQPISAGNVVVLDTDHDNYVAQSLHSYDTRVAGVISSTPGIVLGEPGENKVRVATTGRVKVRVDATRSPIHVGDLLVTSEERGMAMKSEPVEFAGIQMHRPGTLIGKALESLGDGQGEILVLLSLQ